MTFQLQIDKNSFQFHIIYVGMNPIKEGAYDYRKYREYPPRLSRP
jgi:hypothetical protein